MVVVESETGWPVSTDHLFAVGVVGDGSGEMDRERAELVAVQPFESVTPTLTEKLPETVGVQETEAELMVEHPVGRPDQENASPPEPPEAVVENVTAWFASRERFWEGAVADGSE